MTTPTSPIESPDYAARLAAERYQLLATHLPASAVMMFDHDLRFVLVDGPELQRNGYSKAGLEGRLLFDAMDPAFAALVEPNLRAALAGRQFQAELPFGDLVYAYTYVPLFNPDGSVKYAMVVAQDVTPLRRAEQDAIRAEARTREVVASMPAVVFAIGADRRFRFSEGLALSRLGLQPSEVVGRTVEDLYAGHAELLHYVDLALAGQRLVADVTVNDTIWETRYAPILAPDGSVAEAIGVAFDVTERRRAEASSQQSQKLEAVGRLAGGIAHDFNNMLGVIMSSAEELRLSLPQTPELRELAELVIGATDRAAQLTRQLLAFARSAPVAAAPNVIDAVVQEAVALLRRTVDRKIRIQTDLRAGGSVAVVDAAQLQNAIINLGLNARDAMPDGGTMTIATDIVSVGDATPPDEGLRPGPYVRITVGDTGTGISSDDIGRVFDPFFTTKSVGAGTGLGLSVVYGTARGHGGTATVESTPGAGATFRLLLPRSGEPARDAAQTSHAAQIGTGLVLLVEDEPMVQLAGRRILASLGYDVVTASDGLEAVARFEELHERLGMVLCDVIMPGIPGPEVVRRMRAIDPSVPIAMCSGYTSEHLDFLDGTQRLEVLAKPYRRETCAALLARTIRHTR